MLNTCKLVHSQKIWSKFMLKVLALPIFNFIWKFRGIFFSVYCLARLLGVILKLLQSLILYQHISWILGGKINFSNYFPPFNTRVCILLIFAPVSNISPHSILYQTNNSNNTKSFHILLPKFHVGSESATSKSSPHREKFHLILNFQQPGGPE